MAKPITQAAKKYTMAQPKNLRPSFLVMPYPLAMDKHGQAPDTDVVLSPLVEEL
jgi:hypothetical protein